MIGCEVPLRSRLHKTKANTEVEKIKEQAERVQRKNWNIKLKFCFHFHIHSVWMNPNTKLLATATQKCVEHDRNQLRNG